MDGIAPAPGNVTYPTRNFAWSCYSRLTSGGWSFLPASACRHAARTVASSAKADVRRSVSEDSEGEDRLRPFLLIVRTHHVVTAGRGSVGYSEFPAYGRILSLPSLTDRATMS